MRCRAGNGPPGPRDLGRKRFVFLFWGYSSVEVVFIMVAWLDFKRDEPLSIHFSKSSDDVLLVIQDIYSRESRTLLRACSALWTGSMHDLELFAVGHLKAIS